MAKKDQFLTTGEYATKVGLSTSSVTKLIRDGSIKAEKKSGKWMIPADQLKTQAVKDLGKTGKKTVKPAKKKTVARESTSTKKDMPAEAKSTAGKKYTVAEFTEMTYLTEFGVKEWLKLGRLTGQQIAGGEWKIDASNLESPDIKRLVREK